MNMQSTYLTGLAERGIRPDGRKLDEFRRVEILTRFIEKAEGSARVRIGRTDVVAGVKLDVGTPFPDKHDEGVLMIAAELPPLAYHKFEPGPPKEEAIELARVVDRGIRESHALDMKKLCITPKEKCWKVSIDVMVLNHDGNLIDASSLAALAALRNAKFPQFDGERVNAEIKTADSLPLVEQPLGVTVWKVGNVLVVDPTRTEEEAAVARFTVSTIENGNICAIQKGGMEALSMEEIEQAFDLATRKGKELRAIVAETR